MKVEAIVLKSMRAGDGKQGIKFAWPKLYESSHMSPLNSMKSRWFHPI